MTGKRVQGDCLWEACVGDKHSRAASSVGSEGASRGFSPLHKRSRVQHGCFATLGSAGLGARCDAKSARARHQLHLRCKPEAAPCTAPCTHAHVASFQLVCVLAATEGAAGMCTVGGRKNKHGCSECMEPGGELERVGSCICTALQGKSRRESRLKKQQCSQERTKGLPGLRAVCWCHILASACTAPRQGQKRLLAGGLCMCCYCERLERARQQSRRVERFPFAAANSRRAAGLEFVSLRGIDDRQPNTASPKAMPNDEMPSPIWTCKSGTFHVWPHRLLAIVDMEYRSL